MVQRLGTTSHSTSMLPLTATIVRMLSQAAAQMLGTFHAAQVPAMQRRNSSLLTKLRSHDKARVCPTDRVTCSHATQKKMVTCFSEPKRRYCTCNCRRKQSGLRWFVLSRTYQNCLSSHQTFISARDYLTSRNCAGWPARSPSREETQASMWPRVLR